MKLTDEMLSQHAAEARDIWLATLPQREEIPEHRFSHRFTRAMNRLIREQRRTPRMRRMVRYARNAAVFVLVVLTVTFSGLMTVEAYRIAVIDTITRIFHEFTEFRYTSEVSAEDAEFPEVSFGYLPEGMVEAESERVWYEDYHYIYFENSDNLFFDLSETKIVSEGTYTMIVDTENASVTYITVMGTDAMLVEKNGDKFISWIYENIRYDLYGNIPSQELRKIADGLKLK